MAIPKKDMEAIRRLAKEGKRISRIREEDFPELDYWDVYSVVYGSGGRSAQGVKWIIQNRLNQLCEAGKGERQGIIDELNELIWDLYNDFKENQKKLDAIRKLLAK